MNIRSHFIEVDIKNEVFLPVLWSPCRKPPGIMPIIWGWVSDLMGQQYFWVLSRLSVRMEEYPRWGDRIRVKTWLTGTGLLFALRQFSMADSTGKILGTARSAWLVLDFEEPETTKD